MDRRHTISLRTLGPLWRLAAPCVLLPFSTGCQNNQQAYRDLYLRELRLQEDEIYRLEDCIQEYQGVIRDYRTEVHQLKTQLGDTNATGAASSPEPRQRSVLDAPGIDAPPELRPLDVPRGGGVNDAPLDPDVPAIDLGEPAEAPPASPRGGARTPRIDAPPIDIPPIDVPSAEPAPQPPAPGPRYEPSASPLLESLPPLDPGALDSDPLGEAPTWRQGAPTTSSSAPLPLGEQRPLGGLEIESYAGPAVESGEGTLVALIRPRSIAGEPTSYAGTASLMLIDASVEGGRKLARWDFSAEEVAESWRPGSAEPMLDLAVILPSDAPLDHDVQLWARLVDEQHDEKALGQQLIMLGTLASLDQAVLADAEAAPLPGLADLAEGPAAPPVAGDSGWRASDRVAAAVAVGSAADSGWRRSEQPAPEPRKIQLATHEEAAPLAPPAAPEWTPLR